MAKYTFEFKKQIVLEYLTGKIGYASLAKAYNISSKSLIERWVAAYQKFGDDGLRRSRNKTIYPFEFKLSMVKLYLSSELSYQELAIQHGMNNPCLLAQWVSRFRAAGPEALRDRKKGSKKVLDKKKEKIGIEASPTTPDTSAEYIRELEDELLKLRIENAFLKESRRLRLEEEAKMRELQESFTASEDNSN